MVRLNLDPTPFRVVIIAICIFGYTMIVQSGVMTILAERMPEPHEWLLFIFTGLGAVFIYMLGFLGITPPEQTKPPQ